MLFSRAHAEGMQEALNHPAFTSSFRMALAYGIVQKNGCKYKPEVKAMNIHDMLTAYQRINENRLTRPHPLFPPVYQVVEPPEAELTLEVPTL